MFVTSTQREGEGRAHFFEGTKGEGGRALSPIGSRRRKTPGEPQFIEGLYQDKDRRQQAIQEAGGLTFCHSAEGDVELQEHDGSSSIPPRIPPMSASTVDWSILYRPENLKLGVTDKNKKRAVEGKKRGRAAVGSEASTQEGSASQDINNKSIAPNGLGIRLTKGRYSKKRKPHRGGRNKRRKQGFLSEEDLRADA